MRVDASGNQGGFYPYGEDKGTLFANDQVKFATYTRDGGTLLDYADQRFYTSNFGRFLTPDPYRRSGRATVPQSWNRYEYALGDPVNLRDSAGREECDPDDSAWRWNSGVELKHVSLS